MDYPTFKYVFRPENEPDNWGLRGDSELWRYLGALLYQVPIPRESNVALQQVKDAVTNLTGWDCETTREESFGVNLSLFQRGSGMSTGSASALRWVEEGFPMIESLVSTELRDYTELSSQGS